MASTPSEHFISVEEYLHSEAISVDRHEYLNGEVFLMAGGTPAHATIAGNVLASLHAQSDCFVRGSDMRIRTATRGLHSYADVVVSCGDEQFDGETLLNPILIVEVLSKITEDYDRGTKFELYRQIKSFSEYLIIAQDRTYVEHHTREGDSTDWSMRVFTDKEAVIVLRSVKATLALADVYSKVSVESKTL